MLFSLTVQQKLLECDLSHLKINEELNILKVEFMKEFHFSAIWISFNLFELLVDFLHLGYIFMRGWLFTGESVASQIFIDF